MNNLDCNLKPLAGTVAQRQRDLEQLKRRLKKFCAVYKNVGLANVKMVHVSLRYYEQLLAQAHRYHLYHLLAEYSHSTPRHRKQLLAAQAMLLQVEKETFFFKYKLACLPRTLQRQVRGDPRLSNYKHYLERLSSEKKYLLSFLAEEIIQQKNVSGYGALRELYLEIISGLSFKIKGRYLSVSQIESYLNSKSPHLRKRAFKVFHKELGTVLRQITLILNSVVKDWKIDREIRGYENTLSPFLIANELESKWIKRSLRSLQDNLHIFQRLEVLKDKFEAEKGSSSRNRAINISYRNAVAIIRAALMSFSPDVLAIVDDLINSRHVDHVPRKDKSFGSLCIASVPEVAPFIMLNFGGSFSDLYLAAHEFGHAVHLYLSGKRNSFLTYAPNQVLSEACALFFELLVSEYQLQNPEFDKRRAVARVLEIADNQIGKIYRQAANSVFEEAIHAAGGNLYWDEYVRIWRRVGRAFYGNILSPDDGQDYFFLTIVHFVCSPFHCLQYVLGTFMALAFYQEFQRRGQEFAYDFIRILSEGSKLSLGNLLKNVGIDLDNGRIWQKGIDILSKFLLRVERFNTHCYGRKRAGINH